jgi:hypothetical protein
MQEQSGSKPLRLWPGVVIAIATTVVAYGLPVLALDVEVFGYPLGLFTVLAGVVGTLAIVLWWLFFSRAPWFERIGAVVLMVIAVAVTRLVVHESIAGAGMGMLLYISAIPGLALALVAWAAATRRVVGHTRWAWLVAAIALACAPWGLMRTAGVTGGSGSEYHWRWTPTPEERLLAQATNEPLLVERNEATAPAASAPATESPKQPPDPAPPKTAPEPAEAVAKNEPAAPPDAKSERKGAGTSDPTISRAEWPGFRGPHRDGVIRGVQIDTDWSQSPPVELWRRPIGPGWSSFAVRGDMLYTQEQRGEHEIVAAYKVSTGEPVWRHVDAARFYESNGGAGPRGTPTIDRDCVYTFGATGILNALDAATGTVLWTRDASSETGVEIPGWGFASSPLVVDDVVVVAVSGALVGYDRETGEQRWLRPSKGGSYSSPHRATLDGVTQILLLGGSGATSVAPADGTVLWEHAFPGTPIVQPAPLADGDVVISTADAMGGIAVRRIALQHGPDGWTASERWTSRGLKPYFNDYVVHEGHAYGFDGSILSSVDLADGTRKWKGGRYGNGQMVLLPEQDLLLVLSEDGELALVAATAEKFTEVARFRVLDAKTWNHPVLVGDTLLVRNGEEMAAFRMPTAAR